MKSLNFRENLLWWFEAQDWRSGRSFVIGVLDNHNKGDTYIVRTSAITYLDRADSELRTLFQDYKLGIELENFDECALLLAIFGEDPFFTPDVALYSPPYRSTMH